MSDSKDKDSDFHTEQHSTIQELKSRLDKELSALLAHPLIPQDFKAIFEEREQ